MGCIEEWRPALGIWFSCMGFGWRYEDDIIKAIKG